MANYTVNIQELKNKVEVLRTLNSQFKGQVEKLGETEASLGGMWEGSAREAFRNAFSTDRVQMNNFYNAVEVYVERLEAIATKYMQAEAKNTQIAKERRYK